MMKLYDLKEEKLIKEYQIIEDNEDNFIITTLEEELFHIEYLHDN